MHRLIVYIFILCPLLASAQLSAPGAKSVRLSAYTWPSGQKDQLFFYCSLTGAERGSLDAMRPGGAGQYDFKWYRWNDGTDSFSDLLKTDLNVSSSNISDLNEGGYKVEISQGGIADTSMIAWIFLDEKPYAAASLYSQKCSRIALLGVTDPAIDTFFYINPVNGNPVFTKNEINYLWSSEPASSIPFPSYDLIKIIDSPPLEDVTYRFTLNTLGCTDDSAFFYESIHVKADFTVEPNSGGAPLEVNFTDKSIRAAKYIWEFGDDSISYLNDPPPHIYYRPGEYSVKLTIESDLLCRDSLRFDKIVVNPSKLEIPNVFTPDGDGLNEYFVVESESLRKLYVEIFSKSGLKVYTFSGEGEQLSNWVGWDGNVNTSSSKAAPGIYFYVIRAIGWDDKLYDGVEYRGFLYLYR